MNQLVKALAGCLDAFDSINERLAWLSSVILVFVMLVVSADVVLRYFLKRPQVWVLETSAFSLLIVTFLGSAWLLGTDGHVKVDLLVSSLNPRAQALLGVINSVIGGVVCLVLTVFSAVVALDYAQRGVRAATQMMPPQAPFVAIICLGFFLLSIQFARRATRFLRRWRAASREEQLPEEVLTDLTSMHEA